MHGVSIINLIIIGLLIAVFMKFFIFPATAVLIKHWLWYRRCKAKWGSLFTETRKAHLKSKR